ncbi:MAG: response regulator [Archangium sp.]
MTLRVVLADDHPVTRMGLRAVFSSAADLVLVAECVDGRSALAKVLELRPDVAVLDLKLPELTGLEVLAELDEQDSKVPVLFLSAQSNEDYVNQARALGAFGFLTKDTPPEQLIRAVRDVAQRRAVWTSAQRDLFRDASMRPSLSPRELEVLRALSTGASNKEIAQQLGLSDGTVRIHVSIIFGKLDVDDRTAAVTLGLKRGLIELE